MGRLDYSTPTRGKDKPEEGARDRSASFLKYNGRRDESSSAPLVSANTRVCLTDGGNDLAEKLCALALFVEEREKRGA